jgi:N-acetylglucosamine malate deacetylase 1
VTTRKVPFSVYSEEVAVSAAESGIDYLVVSPHPDDEALFVGGLVLAAKRAGRSVGVLYLTRGESGSLGTPEKREAESLAAALLVDLDLSHNLAFPDGGITSGEGVGGGREQLIKLVAFLRDVRPHILVVPYWEERHPDHEAASRLCQRAVFFAGLKKFGMGQSAEPYTPLQMLYYPCRVIPSGVSFVVDTSAVFEEKLVMIRCYGSQVAPTGDVAPQVLVGSPLTEHTIRARDSAFGALIGVEYGEGFVVRNTIAMADPLDHFRRHDTRRAQLFTPSG